MKWGLLLVLFAAPIRSGVVFRTYPRTGSTFEVQLEQSDGGVIWRERGAKAGAPKNGWYDLRVPDRNVRMNSGVVVVTFSRADGGQVTCAQPIHIVPDAGYPSEVFSAELPDGGCHLRVFDAVASREMLKNAWLKNYMASDGGRSHNPVGDFPPYEPPYIHGDRPPGSK